MNIFGKSYQPFNLLSAEQLKKVSTLPHHIIDAMNIDNSILSNCLVWVAFIDAAGRDAILSINHERNRKLNDANKRAIATDALRKRFNWQLGFAIFQNKKLLDAQTRISGLGDASEESGELYPILCIEFPPDENIIDIIDINKTTRSASNSDNYAGFTWPKPVADSFGTINEFLNGGATGRHSTPVVREALRPFFAESLMRVHEMIKDPAFRSTTWIGSTATIYKTHPGEIATFVSNVVNNVDCPRGSITYKVRDHILRTKLTSNEKWRTACIIFNAFEEWRTRGNKMRYELNDSPVAYKSYLLGLVIEEGIPVISLTKDSPAEIVEKLETVDEATKSPAYYAHLLQKPQ